MFEIAPYLPQSGTSNPAQAFFKHALVWRKTSPITNLPSVISGNESYAPDANKACKVVGYRKDRACIKLF